MTGADVTRLGELKLHARQYVIGPEPRLMADDWVARELDEGLVLSHCPRLSVERRSHGLLLGLAVSTDEADDSPDAWAGRWVLIDGDDLHMDAFGMLGCFYRQTPTGLWVSSSAEILRGLDPERPSPPTPLVRTSGPSWFPPPRSGVEGVSRLLASQILDLRSGDIRPRRLLQDGPPLSPEEALARLEGRLRTAFTNVRATRDDIWVALSGGLDSRVILAAAVASGTSVTAYTFTQEGMPELDRDLPPRIARALGVEHREIPLGPTDADAERLFDRHTARHCVDGPREQIARGGWHEIPPTATALGGIGFELARAMSYRALPGRAQGPEAQTAAIVEKQGSADPDGLRAWADWAAANPEPGMDWRDRYHLEQRLGGWASANVQGVDLSGRELVHLACSTAFARELFAFPLGMRRKVYHHQYLMISMAPALEEFAPPDMPPLGSTRGPGGKAPTSFATRVMRRLGRGRRRGSGSR